MTTAVAADGDPVGAMMDKSGNGHHMTQSIASQRPLYRTDGARHWIETDGVDDILFRDLGAVPQPFTIFLAGAVTASGVGAQQVFAAFGGLVKFSNTVRYQAGGNLQTGSITGFGTNNNVAITANGEISEIMVGGDVEASGDAGTNSGGVLSVPGSGGIAVINFFGAAITFSAASSSEKASMAAYYADKMGEAL